MTIYRWDQLILSGVFLACLQPAEGCFSSGHSSFLSLFPLLQLSFLPRLSSTTSVHSPVHSFINLLFSPPLGGFFTARPCETCSNTDIPAMLPLPLWSVINPHKDKGGSIYCLHTYEQQQIVTAVWLKTMLNNLYTHNRSWHKFKSGIQSTESWSLEPGGISEFSDSWLWKVGAKMGRLRGLPCNRGSR